VFQTTIEGEKRVPEGWRKEMDNAATGSDHRAESGSRGGMPEFDLIIHSRGRVNSPQSMIMYSPTIAGRSTELNDALRANMLKHDYEVAALVAASEFPIEYVWSAHSVTARTVGVADEGVEAIRSGGDLGACSERERVIIELGRELIAQQTLSGETFAAARDELGEQVLIETLMTIGYYLMIGMVLIGCSMEPANVGVAPELPSRNR
jgi:alkylhydroperoxidase family enzyme